MLFEGIYGRCAFSPVPSWRCMKPRPCWTTIPSGTSRRQRKRRTRRRATESRSLMKTRKTMTNPAPTLCELTHTPMCPVMFSLTHTHTQRAAIHNINTNMWHLRGIGWPFRSSFLLFPTHALFTFKIQNGCRVSFLKSTPRRLTDCRLRKINRLLPLRQTPHYHFFFLHIN